MDCSWSELDNTIGKLSHLPPNSKNTSPFEIKIDQSNFMRNSIFNLHTSNKSDFRNTQNDNKKIVPNNSTIIRAQVHHSIDWEPTQRECNIKQNYIRSQNKWNPQFDKISIDVEHSKPDLC